ncbi:MAG: 1-phosphofructokinase [Azospirillum brasilense]|nr:MAG: 1-phosphofructokinase [Azospirillum brasilense]
MPPEASQGGASWGGAGQGGVIATVTLNPAMDFTVMLDRLEPGEVNRARGAEMRPAGKGVNVSAMHAVLGQRSAATGLMPRLDADAYARYLAGLGVEDAFHRVPGRARINVKLVEGGDGRVTDVNTPGPEAPADALDGVLARLDAVAPAIVVLSGSLPPGLALDAWAVLARAQRAAGRLVLLDTSGAALGPALEAGVDLIKPNGDELGALLGRRLEGREAVLAAAAEMRGRGIARVIVSAGGDGALFALPEGMLWATPPKVPLTTTVGAGDSMVAGLSAALARGLEPEPMARLATACAAAAVSRPTGGMPDRSTIERLAEAVRIEKL